MKYPCLIIKKMCKTDIHVTLLDEGLNEDGTAIVAFDASLKCNYQDTAKTVMTADKKLVQLSGIAFFTGDICPEMAVISSGEVVVYGVKRTIFKGTKARNPDGTINYSRLDLM